jgi:hypothetical protein
MQKHIAGLVMLTEKDTGDNGTSNMGITDQEISFSERELKEIFELFCSSTEHELNQVYDMSSDSYFERINLSEEYELTLPKREFALDAVRAVLYFLNQRGYKLERNGEVKTLEAVKKHFIR